MTANGGQHGFAGRIQSIQEWPKVPNELSAFIFLLFRRQRLSPLRGKLVSDPN